MDVLGLDARLLIDVSNIVSSKEYTDIDKLVKILNDVGRLVQHHSNLQYCNKANLLGIITFYSSILSFSMNDIYLMVSSFILGEANRPSESKYEDIEEELLAILQRSGAEAAYSGNIQDNHTACIEIANEIVGKVGHFQRMNALTINGDEEYSDLMFKFLKLKIAYENKYIVNMEVFRPFFDRLEGLEEFDKWYMREIGPYLRYSHLFSNAEKHSIEFSYYYSLQTIDEKLVYLSQPIMDESIFEEIDVALYISQVLIPLIALESCDLTKYANIIFSEAPRSYSKSITKYNLWDLFMKSVLRSQTSNSTLDMRKVKFLVKYFLGSCYYYGFYYDLCDRITSLEALKIFDTLLSTLKQLSSVFECDNTDSSDLNHIRIKTRIKDSSESLQGFIDDRADFADFFERGCSSVKFLANAISACIKLFPMCKYGLLDYLNMTSECSSSKEIEKEAIKLLSHLNSRNWKQVLELIFIFEDHFIFIQDEKKHINELIIQRLLKSDLFDVVRSIWESKEISIEINSLFSLIISRYWALYNNSDNFEKNSEDLKKCQQCIDLCEAIYDDKLLSKENSKDLKKVKHLIKGMRTLETFRLTVGKDSKPSPKKILDTFLSSSNEKNFGTSQAPLSLVSLIIEQNPKSYLAFDKLYRMLEDFSLFIDEPNDDPTYHFKRLKSLCIESALIDDNFDYAYKKSIELLEHYNYSKNSSISGFWLTFYQVGKFKSPLWYDGVDAESKLKVLMKQRELLGLCLKFSEHTNSTTDHSRLVLQQWEQINDEIQLLVSTEIVTQDISVAPRKTIEETQPEEGYLTHTVPNEPSTVSDHTGDKLSNLFVSGLGWAIGANQK